MLSRGLAMDCKRKLTEKLVRIWELVDRAHPLLPITVHSLIIASLILVGTFAGCASVVSFAADSETADTDAEEARQPNSIDRSKIVGLQRVDPASLEGSSPNQVKLTKPLPAIHPLSLSGRALTAEGKPLAGATIFVVSTNRIEKTLGQTTTGQDGRYSFRDLPLPVVADTDPNTYADARFEVFGRAPGMAIAWQGMKSINVDPRIQRDSEALDPGYFPGDKIVLDLTFEKPQPVTGRFLDERGQPIAGVDVRLSHCDYLDVSNSRPRTSDHMFWALCQAADLMPDDVMATTDSNGQFQLTSVPAERICALSIEHPDYACKSIYVATSQRKVVEHYGQPVAPLPLNVTLHSPRDCRVQVVFGDTKQPAPGVRVVARDVLAKGNGAYETSDDTGKLVLRLPPGKYEFDCSPPQTSDYVKTLGEYTIAPEPAEQSFEMTVDRGCVVLLKAIDETTGKGIADVGFWSEVNESQKGLPNGRGSLRSTTGGPDLLTNADGLLRAVVYPGKRRFGLGHSPLPENYVFTNGADMMQGRTLNLVAGKTVTAEFKLGRPGLKRAWGNLSNFDFDFIGPFGGDKPYPWSFK